MIIESIFALIIGSFLLLGSPGPAPIALTAIGGAFGVKRGLPFYIGTLCGACVPITCAALFIGQALFVYAPIYWTFIIFSCGYIFYIAYRIATAPLSAFGKTYDHCPKWHHGFILNVTNPKAYAAFFAIFANYPITTHSAHTAQAQEYTVHYWLTAIIVIMTLCIINISWLGFGRVLFGIFQHQKYGRFIRVTMAILMIISVIYAIL